MREINEAFDSLRRAVPGGGEPEKLTKITTLRLAMKYIAALSQVLSDDSSDVESLLSDSTTQSLLDGHISSEYSDFGDTSSLHLDPYADFSSFVLDDPFPADFS
ncbi:hypothetical protein AAG570_008607 [Ranatra chinensis]|uniref:BHLH domain-containing protein n=1 Tax=Ranatra chinensis TaxID=642074 RepID=A0ABD0YTJ8_9HEMI